MKQSLFLTFTLALSALAFTQLKEGKIVYEQKIDLHRRMQDEQMKAMVPQFRTTSFDLFFGDGLSFYKQEEAEPDITDNNPHGGLVLRFGGNNNEYFKNFNTHRQFDKRELGDKDYIVEDSIHTMQWKLSDESRTILGYPCKKATGKTARGSDVEAWYTEEINIPSGPENFGGLPGMILMVDINKGEFVYTAKSVDKTVSRKELKAPSKGKQISPADFDKLQKELLGNQNGPVRIIKN